LISLTDDYRILLSHNKVPAQLRFLFETQKMMSDYGLTQLT